MCSTVSYFSISYTIILLAIIIILMLRCCGSTKYCVMCDKGLIKFPGVQIDLFKFPHKPNIFSLILYVIKRKTSPMTSCTQKI